MDDITVDDAAAALLHRLSLALPRANIDANTEMGFEALPVDVVARILSLATSLIRGHDAWRITSRAACVSQGMRSAADLCWQSHAMSLFPLGALPTDAPKHWLGFRAPHSWRDCVREVATALPMPTWTKFPCAAEEKKEEWAPAPASANHPFGPHGGAVIRSLTAAPPEGARLALPRRTFGHSTVVFDGHVYVYGGRDAQCHSNELNVLPLHIHPLVWRTIPPTESTPSPRRQHTAAIDRRGRMHVVGGGFLAASGERIYRSDAHAFDTRSQSWHATPPPPHGWSCMAHSCVHVPKL